MRVVMEDGEKGDLMASSYSSLQDAVLRLATSADLHQTSSLSLSLSSSQPSSPAPQGDPGGVAGPGQLQRGLSFVSPVLETHKSVRRVGRVKMEAQQAYLAAREKKRRMQWLQLVPPFPLLPLSGLGFGV